MKKAALLDSVWIRCFLEDVVTKAYSHYIDWLEEHPMEVESKASDIAGDLVTSADREIEEFIINEINSKFPDYNIVSEEKGGDLQSAGENYFTIDPIDGTINFANGLPLWAIQVACVTNGKPCAAVILAPALAEIYTADLSGSYKNNVPISVNKHDVANGICDIEGHAKHSARQKYQDRFVHMRDLNSTAIAMAWVACGRLSAVGYYSGDDIYNYLPGMILVKQAGGVILDHHDLHIAANNTEFLTALAE